MKVDRRDKDYSITVQNIRLTFKGHYHPPYLWIERYRPLKHDYEIVVQATANQELAEALIQMAKEIVASKP